VRLTHPFSLTLAGLLVLLSMGMARPSTASAYWYYDGGYKLVTNRGVNCTIETDNPIVGGGDAFSSAWVMCAQNGYGLRYMQVGYLEQDSNGDESPRYFWEWSNSETSWSGVHFLGLAADGSNNAFKITDDSTSFYLLINGNSYASVPKSSLIWSPNDVTVSGETYYATDQVPGTPSNPVSMGPVTYKASNGSWYSAGMTEIATPNHVHPDGGNNLDQGDTSWSIWDTNP